MSHSAEFFHQILALFENSCHPHYNSERASCSLQFLDRIVSVLSLTFIDRHDADVSLFNTRSAPIVFMPDNYRPPKRCCCVASPPSMPGGVDGYHPYSQIIPPWNPSWSEAEIRKEECRRLCWVALALVANYTLQCSAFHVEPMRFFLSDPANVSTPHIAPLFYLSISVYGMLTPRVVRAALPGRGL